MKLMRVDAQPTRAVVRRQGADVSVLGSEFDRSTCSDEVCWVSELLAAHGHHCIFKTCRVKLKKNIKVITAIRTWYRKI